MTRNGKIARLPDDLRLSVNLRLRDGVTGPELLPWLNGLPEVRHVLHLHFHDAPISQQNLSKWHLGGYQDWLVTEDVQELYHMVLVPSPLFRPTPKPDKNG